MLMMESPSVSLTNTLKIENLSRIPYTIYTLTQSPSKASAASLDRGLDILRDAERTLKAEGCPALLSLPSRSLWVFHIDGVLSKATEDAVSGIIEEGQLVEEPPSVEQEKDERWKQLSARLLVDWSLEESSSDVLLSASLSPKPSMRFDGGPHSAASNGPSSTPVTPGIAGPKGSAEAPITIDEDDEETDDNEQPVPYRIFMHAVLSTLTFQLSLQHSFTPLNSRTLASPTSLSLSLEYASEDERRGKEEILPWAPVTAPEVVVPTILEIEAYMTSLGTLVLTPRAETQEAIQRLSTSTLSQTCLHEREALIAPWGAWGRLCSPPEETETPLRRRVEEKWKSSVLSFLQDFGIISFGPLDSQSKSVLQGAIEDGKWVHVEIWLRSADDPSIGDLHRILWPEALLFLRSSEGDKTEALPLGDGQDHDLWKLVFDDVEYISLASERLARLVVTLDCKDQVERRERDLGAEWWDVESSLKWAEEWAKKQPDREKLLNAAAKEKRLKEEAAKAEALERDALKEGDAQRAKAKPIIGRSDSNVGGVYPTPPDAAAAAINGAIPPGGAQPLATGSRSDLDFSWTTGDQKKEFDDTLEATLPAEVDLFGDGMDEIEMAGITEDDFNFFDNAPDLGFGGDVGDMDIDIDAVDMNLQGVDSMAIAIDQQQAYMESPSAAPQLNNDSRMMEDATLPTQQEPLDRAALQDSIPQFKQPPGGQVRTPPLSPHRAIRLLVPGYSPPMTNGTNFTPPTTGSIQTPSTAATTVAAYPPAPPSGTTQRRLSLYAPIPFTENVEVADRKYAPGGRFFLPETNADDSSVLRDGVTKPFQLHQIKKKRSSITARSKPIVEVPPPPIEYHEDGDSGSNWSELETESSDADDTNDDESIDRGERYLTSPLPGGMRFQSEFMPLVGRKRKLPGAGPSDSDVPMVDVFPMHRDTAVGTDAEVDIASDIAPAPWEVMRPHPLDESLIGAFTSTLVAGEPLTLGTLGEMEFITVTSLVADQMAGWVHSSWSGKSETAGDAEDEEAFLVRRRSGRDCSLVEEAVRLVFKEGMVRRCDLETYASIADAVQVPPPLPPPPPLDNSHLGNKTSMIRPNISQRRNKEEHKIWDVFLLQPPHVRLQRGDNTFEMLPPALHFWETFGLAPVSGSKNVISFCFHPAASALEEGADYLLERLSASYEAGRFGAHVRGSLGDVVKDGLVPVELPDKGARSYEVAMRALTTQMEAFGPTIAHGVADEGENVVIYIINPFQHPAAMVDICAGFVRMRRCYEAAIATTSGAKPNNLVLQIVPVSFVAHKIGIVLRVNVAHRLAVEVYTRCIQTDAGTNYEDSKAVLTPPVQLARPHPKAIDFRLTPDPSPALLKENQLLHLTYTQSLDERWVSAAWSDDTGAVQKTTIINLGRRNTTYLRPFADVLSDLWSITRELIRYPAVKWRLAVVRLGTHMPDDEQLMWQNMLLSGSSRISAFYLLSTNLHPALHISDHLVVEGRTDAVYPTPQYSTPPLANTPTPGASILSPDTSAATPAASSAEPQSDLDPDAEITDAMDECWGVIFAHSLPAGDGIGAEERNRASGALIRRAPGPEVWSVLCTLSVVAGGGKEVLREVLRSWRGLGVINSFQRGKGGLPWNVSWCEDVTERIAGVV